jgi:ComF family protein
MKLTILDIFFPRFCSGCRRIGSYICSRCKSEIRYITNDVRLELGAEKVDGAAAVVAYRGVVTQVIKDSKYRLAAAALEEFMEVIEPAMIHTARRLMSVSNTIELLPVPLHPKRHRARGFNQAEIIAQRIGKLTDVKVTKCLRRVRHNVPQAHLPHDLSRAHNVKGIFEVTSNAVIADRDFIVIDDVVTTGSTVSEAAGTLKAAGARRVFVFALAKG